MSIYEFMEDFDNEELSITASMVAANKTVTVTSSNLDKLTWATHVYINYLYNEASGVYPTVDQVGMFKNV